MNKKLGIIAIAIGVLQAFGFFFAGFKTGKDGADRWYHRGIIVELAGKYCSEYVSGKFSRGWAVRDDGNCYLEDAPNPQSIATNIVLPGEVAVATCNSKSTVSDCILEVPKPKRVISRDQTIWACPKGFYADLQHYGESIDKEYAKPICEVETKPDFTWIDDMLKERKGKKK
jgi:hypothetical protein